MSQNERHDDAESHEILNKYQALGAKVISIGDDDEEGVEIVQQVMDSKEELFARVDRMNEFKADVELTYATASKIVNIAEYERRGRSNIDLDGLYDKLKQMIASQSAGTTMKKLGKVASAQSKRPPVIDFMVGPISLTRKVVERRKPGERLRFDEDQQQSTRQLQSDEVVNQNLQDQQTVTIRQIYTVLRQQVENSGGPVHYYEFVINPHDFAQTNENMFFLSFLVRDSKVKLDVDDDDLPVLSIAEPAEREDGSQAKRRKVSQTVISMDYDSYLKLIDLYDIKDAIIPNRDYSGLAF